MRRSVRGWLRSSAAVAAVLAAATVGLVVPASAEGAEQIGGSAYVVAVSDGVNPAWTDDCPEPEGYEDFSFLTIELVEGNLQGCWYTLVEEYSFSPNVDASPVVYQERGREVFVGELYDDAGNLMGEGTFETTYKFTGQYEDASLFVELHGRCQHPIVDGTGTGVFAGASGRVDFKDNVDTGELTYRGHLK